MRVLLYSSLPACPHSLLRKHEIADAVPVAFAGYVFFSYMLHCPQFLDVTPKSACSVPAYAQGRGEFRPHFQDVEGRTPVILTTSQMLTTGVDMPTCKNVVLARVVGSMSEFKQIIGRGTRVRDEYGRTKRN